MQKKGTGLFFFGFFGFFFEVFFLQFSFSRVFFFFLFFFDFAAKFFLRFPLHMPDMMSWILQGQVLIDSEEESSDSEDEEEIISDRRFLRGASPPNEGFSRLLGEWFVQRGKKRCHPQDTLSPFHNREEVHHQPTKRQQRGSLRIVKIDDDESEGSTSSEKTETLNLANPSQCVEELRSSGLTDIFLQKLKPYLEKSPLEFIRMGGIPVLVERILQSYQEEGFPKTKDLVSCFQSTYEGLENYLETLSNSSKVCFLFVYVFNHHYLFLSFFLSLLPLTSF